jgi:hypothetical protein
VDVYSRVDLQTRTDLSDDPVATRFPIGFHDIERILLGGGALEALEGQETGRFQATYDCGWGTPPRALITMWSL